MSFDVDSTRRDWLPFGDSMGVVVAEGTSLFGDGVTKGMESTFGDGTGDVGRGEESLFGDGGNRGEGSPFGDELGELEEEGGSPFGDVAIAGELAVWWLEEGCILRISKMSC